MTRKFMRLQALLALVVAGAAYGQGKGKCSNPVLRWEIRASYPVGLGSGPTKIVAGDAKGTFIHGVDSVEAVINACSSSFDATLSTGKRSVSVNLGAPVAGVAPSLPASGSAFFNIRNLRWLDASEEGLFSTWMSANIPSPRNAEYRLRFFSPNADHTGTIISPAELAATNSPLVTSRVNVYHCPVLVPTPAAGQCAGVTKETWFVYPDPSPTTYANGAPSVFSNVGSVVDSSTAVVGQFQVPYYFVLSIK